MTDYSQLQARITEIIRRGDRAQGLTVRVTLSDDVLQVIYRFDYSEREFMNVIRLDDPLVQDESMLIAYLCYKAGVTLEWHAAREKMVDVMRVIKRDFVIDGSEL